MAALLLVAAAGAAGSLRLIRPGGPPPGERGPAPGQGASAALLFGRPLNLNRAGARDLEALPGIGPRKAARIVAYRAAHGRFASLRDLLRVPGIGPATLERLRPYLIVTPLPGSRSRFGTGTPPPPG